MHIELNLPEQKSGEWSLETFYEEGKKYQRLMKGNFLIMDNSPFIVTDYVDFLQQAKGSIHINGLGIGLCCQYLLSKKTVTELVVIEYDEMIVQMVAPHFSDDPRCTILQGDAFAYEPPSGKVYDFVWHDIWFYRTAKNLEDMERLFRKYEPFAKKQEAWSREKCEELSRKERKQLAY